MNVVPVHTHSNPVRLRQFVLALIILAGSGYSTIQAQKLELFLDGNYGIPLSTSLQEFHQELADQVGIEGFTTTDDFGNQYGFSTGLRFNNKISAIFGYRVSGAKTSLADYSGFIRLTSDLKGYFVGAMYELPLLESNRSVLSAAFKLQAAFSELEVRSELDVQGELSESESVSLKAFDPGAGIGIRYEYRLAFITLRAFVDTEFYINGDIRPEEDPSGDAFLVNEQGDKVRTPWTSIQTGIGLLIPLIR